jgi:spore coat polysaccharide biosynthesis protein SpsF
MICATIEARMSSSRLPGKVMLPLAGKPMLEHIIERIKKSLLVEKVIVATTKEIADDCIENFCIKKSYLCYRGSTNNIVERILGAVTPYQPEYLLQATGDNPLIDPVHIDKTLKILIDQKADFASNNATQTFPIGYDVRTFTYAALQKVRESTIDPVDLVHGSYYIYRNPEIFPCVSWTATKEFKAPQYRLTVDEADDYELIKKIYASLYQEDPVFGYEKVFRFLKENPELAKINCKVTQKQAEEK